MTGISASEEDRPAPAGAETKTWLGTPTVKRWISALEHSQDVVTVTVGVLLIALSVVLLISGIVDFASAAGNASRARRRTCSTGCCWS